ncbi:hypothetical protein FA13DRAFT_250994 [Coprinellus micaceus]|uniref:Uncharacterized protein n=1 Tax=Coprinellus micaceus TaxID=71717 RepID=A0A4Y7TE32_COPMI|nr:hypothetical protein FA13DRAFT_250994 [Coprinellus micaceus]
MPHQTPHPRCFGAGRDWKHYESGSDAHLHHLIFGKCLGLVSSGELTLRLYWSWFHTIGGYNNCHSQAQGAPLKSSYLLVPVGPAIRLVGVTCAHKLCRPSHSRPTTTVGGGYN